MTPVKKFLLVLAGIYLVLALAIVAVWGPPGLSANYKEEHGADHDAYLEFSKSDAHKLYSQLRALEGTPGYPTRHDVIEKVYADFAGLTLTPEELHAAIDFVDEYESREQFQREERRRFWFVQLMDLLNKGAFIVLVVRFAPKPLMTMLDGRIKAIRERVENSARVRQAAEERRAAAKAKVDGLDEEKRTLEQQGEEYAAKLEERIAGETKDGLAKLDREAENRKEEERHRAALLVKTELIEQAVANLAEAYAARRSEETEARLAEHFAAEMEQRS